MKKILILFIAITVSFTGFSQSPSFENSELVFNAGIGFGSSLYGSGYRTTLPAISISGEYGIVEDIITDNLNLGVGGYLGIASSKSDRSYFGAPYGVKTNYTVIGVRGALHYPFVDKLDTYAGIMLGARIVSNRIYGDYPYATYPDNGLEFSLYAGARYYLNDNFAVLGELGYGVAYLNLGVAYKL